MTTAMAAAPKFVRERIPKEEEEGEKNTEEKAKFNFRSSGEKYWRIQLASP